MHGRPACQARRREEEEKGQAPDRLRPHDYRHHDMRVTDENLNSGLRLRAVLLIRLTLAEGRRNLGTGAAPPRREPGVAPRRRLLAVMPGDHASASASAASHHQSAAAKAWLRQRGKQITVVRGHRPPASNNIACPLQPISTTWWW